MEQIQPSFEELVEKKKAEQLANFQKNIDAMIGTNSKAYQRSPAWGDSVSSTSYTIDDINTIIAKGDPIQMRGLSKFFYRYSGVYRRIIGYYANLLLYYTVISPKMTGATIAKNKIKARFNKALDFVDGMTLPINCSRIIEQMLSTGVYYGFLREYKDSIAFQDLSVEYCRTRYKNEYGIDILEFDLRYFNTIRDEEERKIALANFPVEVIKAYNAYSGGGTKKKSVNEWYTVPSYLGAAFYFHDLTPLFVASLGALVRYSDSQEREANRDEEELQKILINEMPLDKENEPVFSLEETAIIHNGIAAMLTGNRYLDVLTTFGKVHMEQTQNARAAANQDNTAKFEGAIYNEIGASSEIFNAEGNTALKVSIEKDTSLMLSFVNIIMEWAAYQLNYRYGDDKMSFDVQVLPVTIHNKKEMSALYLNGAMYGYSKFYAGVALGIKQSNLISLVSIENEIFDLGTKMVPLQSSHTQGDGNSKDPKAAGDNKNGPGRPELDEKDKSDKTIANENSE